MKRKIKNRAGYQYRETSSHQPTHRCKEIFAKNVIVHTGKYGEKECQSNTGR